MQYEETSTKDKIMDIRSVYDVEKYDSEEFGTIRTVTINNEPWFVASDICKALDIVNTTQAVQRLDDDERSMFNIGRQGEANIVNEFGLYNLILISRKEGAKAFKRWITHEVIPSIRKHGIYATENVVDEMLNNPDFAIKLLEKLKEEREGRIKAERKNAILTHVNKTYTMTEIAKELNLKSAIQLNKMLADRKIQYQSNGTWVFYSKYSDLGYEQIKQEVLDNGKVIYHRRITQLGREFILELFDEQQTA